MAEITNYSTLVTAVQDAAEDDSQEFLNYIPTAIGIAEQRLTRKLDSLGLEFVTSVTCSANSRLLTKSADIRLPKMLTYTNAAGETVLLEKRTRSYIDDYWPIPTSVGEPKYYSDVGTSNFIIAPTPSINTTFEVTYQGRPAALTSAAPSNYFTNYCPDALFYATMVEQSKFMKYWSTVDRWKMEENEAVETILNESRRARTDEGDQPANPEGGSSTLMKDSV